MNDYYKILEIESGADILTIKKAYRRLALKFHPDKNKALDASQKFIEITEAYEVLRDPYRRKEYDKIYEIHYKTKTKPEFVKSEFEKTYENKQREWADYGKEKAKEYSSVPFDEFARILLKEISIGINFIPNLLAILITLTTGILFLTHLPTNGGYPTDFAGLIVVFSIGAFYLSYRLFVVARLDYNEERKRKILNRK